MIIFTVSNPIYSHPQAVQIGCELEDLQKAVGGDIEATYPFNEPVALVMHDEGKLVGKELNRALRDDDGDIYDITTRRKSWLRSQIKQM